MHLNDVCDYIIVKTTEGGEALNLLKLQKLVYYVQAWHLAFHNRPLFDGKFQAWVHGPVSRALYARFAGDKSLYSPVGPEDVRPGFNPDLINAEDRAHIDAVLELYAPLTGSQLEEMTHREAPWQEARRGFAPSARCENEISEASMASYYAKRLPKDDPASATTR